MEKSGKKMWILLLVLLILFLLFVFYISYRFFLSNPIRNNVETNSPLTSPKETQVVDVSPTETQTIIKCQSVVVAPTTTTELFAYKSGKKIFADYRVGAASDQDSFKTQILYDGQWVYMWQPPNYFGQEPKPTNPPGVKMKMDDFDFDINITKIGEAELFGKSPLSGDHMCSEWDGLDSIFDLPTDFTFTESNEALQSVKMQQGKICRTCDGAESSELTSTCRINLACD